MSRETYTVVMEDAPLHTDDAPFCYVDDTCPCHSDEGNIAQVMESVEDGLMTMNEAEEYVAGRIR